MFLRNLLVRAGIAIAGLVIAAGFLRVYHGSAIGWRLVTKASFSFEDTVVNLDDILGQPRIAFASNHPAVKRQLEAMGVIETDDQARKKLRDEMERRTEELRRRPGR